VVLQRRGQREQFRDYADSRAQHDGRRVLAAGEKPAVATAFAAYLVSDGFGMTGEIAEIKIRLARRRRNNPKQNESRDRQRGYEPEKHERQRGGNNLEYQRVGYWNSEMKPMRSAARRKALLAVRPFPSTPGVRSAASGRAQSATERMVTQMLGPNGGA